MSESSTATHDDLRDELRSWLEQNWDPDLTVGDWWERLGLAACGARRGSRGRGRRRRAIGGRGGRCAGRILICHVVVFCFLGTHRDAGAARVGDTGGAR
jgi:hypothetical protein